MPRKMLALILGLLILLQALLAPKTRAEGYDMPYAIEVDISSQIVTIYDAATGQIARQMICSTGTRNYTPTGEFTLPKAKKRDERKPWYYITMFDMYVKYATRIYGQILFHSLPYKRKSLLSVDAKAVEQLGTAASHGCIRLRWQDAEFIALNCKPGTKVRILRSGQTKDALRELLLQDAYDASTGLSYDTFLGITAEEGALGRSSQGSDVLNLQYRLRDLGLYGGELSGVYDSKTVNAVRMAQYLMGEEVNGVATAELQQRIFAADAPTAMDVALSEGMSGPAVRVLQDGLAALKLYDDPSDSVYDVAVVEAVKRFQQAYGYEADGVASPEVQKAVAYEGQRLMEVFGGDDYALETSGEQVTLARVSARAGIKLRERASQDSRAVKRLSYGDKLVVEELGESWSRVLSDGDEGYVKNSLVEIAELEMDVLNYTSGEDGPVYTVGNRVSDYLAGTRLPSEVFAEYLAANDRQVDAGSLVNYVTVDTGGTGSVLNLRQSPNPDSAVLDTVEEGVSLRVVRRYVDWTQVTYRGREGYLMNAYLKFWTGPEDALDEALDGDKVDPSEVLYAVVETAAQEDAEVYGADSDDARLLGHLPDGVQVDVLEMGDGWCRIGYKGREGYMFAENLRLVFSEEEEEPEGEVVDDRLTDELRS